ncbi:hypothetical protein RYX36_030980 [Vicia faba]
MNVSEMQVAGSSSSSKLTSPEPICVHAVQVHAVVNLSSQLYQMLGLNSTYTMYFCIFGREEKYKEDAKLEFNIYILSNTKLHTFLFLICNLS